MARMRSSVFFDDGEFVHASGKETWVSFEMGDAIITLYIDDEEYCKSLIEAINSCAPADYTQETVPDDEIAF